jgi:hemerythrin-like domain-containing protein
VPVESLREVVEFMRTFADKCHHGKEEHLLFPLLEQKGVPIHGCPLGVLIQEHERGRALVTELAEAVGAYAGTSGDGTRERLHRSLHGLTELYPGHMWREEYLLFPMTAKVLGAEELRTLHAQFDHLELEIGDGAHARYQQLAERLEGKVRQLA